VNLANTITVGRLLLVPVFLALAYSRSDSAIVAALVVFVVASASDSLDGYIARRSGTITRTGQFLDPLADKVLVVAALVVLVDNRGFPVVAAAVIFLRELAVQILRNRIVAAGNDLPASLAAKVKTVLQVAMVSWWLLPWGRTTAVHWLLLGAAVVATLLSGAQYFVRFLAVREETS
jgi:CDP-diacylglycerol---glycerol-3-phosphate 3-phosphatidyltransferase